VTQPLIHQLLERAAAGGPERAAVIEPDRTHSYGELDRTSSQLAHALIHHGVRPGDRVGLLLAKSFEAVAAIYGVLKAGAVYVPLDDEAPARRLGYIARDAGIGCLVTSGASAADWQRLVEAGAPLHTVVGSDHERSGAAGPSRLPWSGLSEYPDTPPAVGVAPDSLAYILYTSGSTGEPKGVMLSHQNAIAFADWAAREVGIGSQDRLSSHAPFHFDLSVFDLFAAAWGGAAVVLVPRVTSIFPVELTKFIGEQRITVWYSVPSALTLLVLRGELDQRPLPALRAIVFAGEVFPTKYLARLMELVPQARYYNFFGPTETNVCTWYEVAPNQQLGDSVPIGRPIAGVTATIEREGGAPAAEGEVGELLIAGPTVMHGYWGDPERTARVLSSRGGERVYRTGDLVRRERSGDLVFIGRRDAQIKTRGYRVELGEIEAALHALECVQEAAVVAVPDETVTNRLKAFVVTRDPVSELELARLCGQRLPHYMIPDEFEFRAELPKSTTGKVDRRALQS
jgi:amino acid adenylation domain-containing protein